MWVASIREYETVDFLFRWTRHTNVVSPCILERIFHLEIFFGSSALVEILVTSIKIFASTYSITNVKHVPSSRQPPTAHRNRTTNVQTCRRPRLLMVAVTNPGRCYAELGNLALWYASIPVCTLEVLHRRKQNKWNVKISWLNTSISSTIEWTEERAKWDINYKRMLIRDVLGGMENHYIFIISYVPERDLLQDYYSYKELRQRQEISWMKVVCLFERLLFIVISSQPAEDDFY